MQYLDPRSCVFPHLEEKAARPIQIWDYPINLNSVSKPTIVFFLLYCYKEIFKNSAIVRDLKWEERNLLAFYGLFTVLTI